MVWSSVVDDCLFPDPDIEACVLNWDYFIIELSQMIIFQAIFFFRLVD